MIVALQIFTIAIALTAFVCCYIAVVIGKEEKSENENEVDRLK